jgi:flagellar hook assembly protein FlgD
MTVVEKLDELTKSNAELLSANRALSASSLIGRSVVYDDATGTRVTQQVTGVRLESSGPVLITGSGSILLGAVKEVRPAAGT